MFNRKGQNIVEYSILIALVIGAAVAMNTFVKRGLQGRIHEATNYHPNVTMAGSATLVFNTSQYEPYYVDSDSNQKSYRTATENVLGNGSVDRSGIVESSIVLDGGRDTVLAANATTRGD
jgi:hypothetical protein